VTDGSQQKVSQSLLGFPACNALQHRTTTARKYLDRNQGDHDYRKYDNPLSTIN